jgi:hypothetical protein
MPPFTRKNVHKAPADRKDAYHQECSGPNNVRHNNASSIVVVRAELDTEILAYCAKVLFDYDSAKF